MKFVVEKLLQSYAYLREGRLPFATHHSYNVTKAT